MEYPISTNLVPLFLIAACTASAAALQEWTFDQPDGTQLTGLTNSGTPGDAVWTADASGLEVLGGTLRVVDTESNIFVNSSDFSDANTGIYELLWTISSARVISPENFVTWGLSVRNLDPLSDLLTVRLQYATAASELRLQTSNGSGGWVTAFDFDAESVTNVKIRVVFDLDKDLYAVFVDNNGTGEVPAQEGIPMVDGKMDVLRLGGTTPNLGAGNYIDIDNLALIGPPPAAPTWADYEIVNDYVDTGSWIGWMYVGTAPWLYNLSLGKWVYIEENFVTQSGSWVYIPK